MTKANYIDWENLRNIPFFLCQVVEGEQNQEIVLYYLGERVFHDYDHVGHYLRSAIVLFQQIRNRTADWVNLENLWTLRNCIRETSSSFASLLGLFRYLLKSFLYCVE